MSDQDRKGQSVVAASVLMTVATLVTYACGLLASIFTARSLGVDRFGHYSYFVWVTTLACMVANNGLSLSVQRFVAEARGGGKTNEAKIVFSWFRRMHRICIAISLPVIVALLAFLYPSGFGPNTMMFVAIGLVIAVAKSSYLFTVSSAKGFGHFEVEAIASSLGAALAAIGAAVGFWLSISFESFLLLFASTNLSYYVVARATFQKQRWVQVSSTRDKVSIEQSHSFIRHWIWSSILVLVGTTSSIFIIIFFLNRYTGSENVALFTIALSLTRAGMDLLSAGISSVLTSALAQAYGRGGDAELRAYSGTPVRVYFCLGLLITGAGSLLAGPAISVLYGGKFLGAEAVMIVMCVIGGLTFLDGVFSSMLSTSGRQSIVVASMLLSASVTFLLCVCLIPAYGIIGALIAHSVGRVAGFGMLGWRVSVSMSVRMPSTYVAKALGLFSIAFLLSWVWIAAIGEMLGQSIAGFAFCLTFCLLALKGNLLRSSDLVPAQDMLYRLQTFRRALGRSLIR